MYLEQVPQLVFKNKNEEDNQENDFKIIQEEISEVNFSFKLIVIGDSSVGKSSLTLRGTQDFFEEVYTSTIAFEFRTFIIKIKNKFIKLQIWDTCGQEVYRSLISSFYRNASLAIIVYSIDNQESFDNLESWLDEIKSNTHPNIKIFLIGNKLDLENKRVIDKNMAEELVKEHNLDLFLETSAKEGINAQKVFVTAAQMLLEDYKKYEDSEENDSYFSKDKISVSTNTLTYNNENDVENNENGYKNKKWCC